MTIETIILQNVTGFASRSGEDTNGCKWVEFEVDYGAEQTDGECCICDATISHGWLCLDGGDEVCADHVLTDPDEIADFAHKCQQLLAEAVGRWPEFDNPTIPVNGGDLVEWFAGWREKACQTLAGKAI